MVGLITSDMQRSLEFYERLGMPMPGDPARTHVEYEPAEVTFFLDSRPGLWDPEHEAKPYGMLLEFYLETADAVTEKHAEMVAHGYQDVRAPYDTAFGMCFAMIADPDGNTVLLSGASDHQTAIRP